MRYVRIYMLNSNRCDGLQKLKKVTWILNNGIRGRIKKLNLGDPVVDDILIIQDLMSIF
jgi:hypothetical protein